MAFQSQRGAPHALVPALFIAAALINLVLTDVLAGGPESVNLAENLTDIFVYAAPHVLFLARVLMAVRYSAGQRAHDLAEFERLRQ